LYTGQTIIIDTTAPTVALTYSPNRAVKSGDSVTVTATFSEAMASSPTIAIAVPSGGTNAVTSTAMTSTSSSVWTYAYTVGTGNGTATVTIAGTDVALNANASATNATFTVDNTAPVVALTYAIASSVPANATAAAALTYASSASRPVTTGDIVVVKAVTTEATGLASALVLSLDGSRTITALETYNTSSSVGTTYFTHTVASGNDGSATVSVTAPDTAGNAAVASGTTTFTVDTTAPTAATSLALAATGGTNQVANTLNAGNTNFTVTATITGDVGSAGGTAELLVGGASFSTPVTAIVASGATSVSLTPSFTTTTAVQAAMAAGTLSVTLKLTDSAGNVATSGALSVLADYTDPTAATGLALTATGGTNQVANALNAGNTNFTVTATITGDVGTGGGTAELLVGAASFSTPVTASVASGATTVSLTPSFTTAAQVQAAMSDGSKSLTVKLTDSAGNVTTSSALTVLADYTAPTAATGLAFTASGGTVVSNALNATNTNFTVTAT
ncbi:MAG: hypothetical protein EBS94_17180, partial [Proteobacteria bacterium]|nr:hypothetical protein [Pseudomonadota bacterium]